MLLAIPIKNRYGVPIDYRHGAIMAKTNAAFMSGVPELLVLKILQKQELYGYELLKEIRQQTGEVIVLAEGVVYPSLHGLERRGLLRSKKKKVDARIRVYYSLTAKGKLRLKVLTQEWNKISTAINTCLGVTYGQ